ncbi:MAG: YraN family protein [Bacteroidota bacterium]|nr:YraN family protein [Bacteroidota bacterium]MDP4227758.1 YraN family protein [Bacteroidota bacterium]MDP4273016.1 YraN family protein [Bacteroidota bacterium]
MSESMDTGDKGEEIAAAMLVKKGYKILHRNWQYIHKELDIVAAKDNMVVFVEVKTRKSPDFDTPSEAVTRKKQRFIVEAANAYISKYDIQYESRFDIVSVIFYEKSYRIEHIQDAFYPSVR